MSKAAFLICAYVCTQTIRAQCIGATWAAPSAGPVANILDYPGCAPWTPAASNIGDFVVNSASPIAPSGVYMTSENVYNGALFVSGQLPFLSAIALEGVLPSTGAGIVAYGCGDGTVAILTEDMAPQDPHGYGPGPLAYGTGPAPYGGPQGFGGYGFGSLF